MRTRNQRHRRRAGFSLLEVLIVVAIIVLLAGVGGVIYMRYLDDAKLDAARLDLDKLTQAVETYKVKWGDYPASLEVLTQRSPDGSAAYLEMEALIDPWQRPYVFMREERHPQTLKPLIYSQGPNPGDQAGQIRNWTDYQGLVQ